MRAVCFRTIVASGIAVETHLQYFCHLFSNCEQVMLLLTDSFSEILDSFVKFIMNCITCIIDFVEIGRS